MLETVTGASYKVRTKEPTGALYDHRSEHKLSHKSPIPRKFSAEEPPSWQQDKSAAHEPSSGPTRRRRRGKTEASDPMAPKRPTNAFHIYCQESRGALKEELGRESVGLSETTRILASRWAGLDEAGQRKYYDLWERSKKKYAVDLKNYALEIQKKNT